MIAKLTGIIDGIFDDYLILDVNGVGYKVFASSKTLTGLVSGAAISMTIETVVREDAFLLYGFKNTEEQYWFNLLTNVQGVGAKVALGILSSLSANELTLAIASGDKTTLNRANGVGPKLAMRLITELKDKVQTIAIPMIQKDEAKSKKSNTSNNEPDSTTAMNEAISALVNLGYQKISAMEVVAKILSNNPSYKTEELIRLSLKELSN